MKILKKLVAATAAVAIGALFAISNPASASTVNLLTNGDFETGDLTGWSLDDPTGFTTVGPLFSNQVLFGGATGMSAYLWQTVATTIGQSYTLSFDLTNILLSGDGQSFTAGLNLHGSTPDPLLTLTSTSVTGTGSLPDFTNYIVTFVATGSTTDVSFAIRNDAFYWGLDNVTLTAKDDVAVTPLPGSAFLFLSGLGLIGVIAWRHQRGNNAHQMAA